MSDSSLAIGGHSLTYRWIGPPPSDAPTLVFLHEGLGSVTQWRDFPDAVAAGTGCGALVYNRRGHGTSDPLEGPRAADFMHDEATGDLPAVLHALGVTRPILVGHSDGASIALIYAGSRLGPLEALVLEAPHVFVEDLSVESIARMKTIYDGTDLPTRLARHHGANTERMFRGWNDVWLSPAFRDWNIEPYLSRIDCPVFVLQGEDDEYGTVAQVEAIARQTRDCQTLVLADCGHAPHLDQREAAEQAMGAFVIDRVMTRRGH